MWKRLKGGRSRQPETNHNKSNPPYPTDDGPGTTSEPSIPAVPEPDDRGRQLSLPESTLSIRSRFGRSPRRSPRRESTTVDIGLLESRQEGGSPRPQHQRQRSQDSRQPDPLGLFVLHEPEKRTVDILFIHGLGGTSMRTWCHNRDLDYLWPQYWLPQDLPTARVLTFGYNANFSSKKQQSSLTISDFANDLLFRMKYGEEGASRLGQVPIIVVAHSMGGLIFKKAFIQGSINDEFKSIIAQIKAVLFLATPHRGTDLADTLNKVLTSSLFGHTPKDYVAELARRSSTLDELNEAFRHHASKLTIFSFYETLNTLVGPISILLLNKNVSLMGYPNETTQPLIANHHTVCKYTDSEDPNYSCVLGAIRSVVDSLSGRENGSDETQQQVKEELDHIKVMLGMAGPPEEDLAAGRAIRKPGTCGTFLDNTEVQQWLEGKSTRLLWANAPPGSGKSVLSSFIVEHLLDQPRDQVHVAYFFFKHGHRQKRSTANMLRSLAFQMATAIPSFRRALGEMARSGAKLHNADSMTVWKKLYDQVLADTLIPDQNRIYWIIDGIDESESAKQVVELFSRLYDFQCPIGVLAFSRPLPVLSQAFQMARKRLPVAEMALPSNQHDIRLVVAGEMDYLPSDDDSFRAEAIEEITSRAQGNFLWATLVLQRVTSCHRQEQVRRVLEATPDGMEQLYDRMLDVIIDLELEEDKALARILLSWAMYAKSPLTVEELSEVYPSEFHSIMNLSHTINQVCGQFVVINPDNRITLVHHSAREYLRKTKRRPFNLEIQKASEELFGKCLVTLCDRNLRRRIGTLKVPQFLPYAATCWAFHLENSSAEADRVLDALTRFFGGIYSLPWLQYLAMSSRLSELFTMSRKLTAYVRRRRKVDAEKSPMLHRLADLSLIESWAIDLMKIPAKFGRHLTENPALIYSCIPALSPTSSAIYQKFGASSNATLSVSGLSNTEWDDCLARVSASENGRALRVASSSLHLAVATDDLPKGNITMWDTNLFDEHQSFNVGEHVWELAFNKTGSLLACYNVSKTNIWRTHDGSLELSVNNPPRQERAIEFKFNDKNELFMVTDLRRVYKLPFKGTHEEALEMGWQQLDPSLLEETDVPEGTFLSTPSSVAFNHDCTQIAVAYRSFPLSVWNIDPPEMVARLVRRNEGLGAGSANSHTGDNKVVWHPSGTQVVGIYGQIFRWNPYDDTYEEVKDTNLPGEKKGVIPHGIQCSPNGLVFITCDVEGSIKIYDVASMSLVYKISSEDRISQICFSPETVSSARFYDLRGFYCNIWEPNCLLRLMDSTDKAGGGDGDSLSSSMKDSFWSDPDDDVLSSSGVSSSLFGGPSESRADCKAMITIVAPSPRGPTSTNAGNGFIAYANNSGLIEVYHPQSQTKQQIAKSMFGMAVEQLVWDNKHNLLAYAFSNGAVSVKAISTSVSPNTTISPATSSSFGTDSRRRQETITTIGKKDTYTEKRAPPGRGRTRQLLFNTTGTKLLVHSAKKTQVLSMPGGELLAECDIATSMSEDESALDENTWLWMVHPTSPDKYLLCLVPTRSHVKSEGSCADAQSIAKLRTYTWDKLERQTQLPTPFASLLSPGSSAIGDHVPKQQPTILIDAIIPSHHPDYILLRTITTRQNRPYYDFVVLSVIGIAGSMDQQGNKTNNHTSSDNAAPITIALNGGSVISTDAGGEEAPESNPIINPNEPTTVTIHADNAIPLIPINLGFFIHSQVKHPIGILPDGRLVFIDRKLWVCTAQLLFPQEATSISRRVTNTSPVSNEIKRHFFLPHDWVTASGLRLCRVLRDGTVLCPSKGEVAVIGGDLV